MPLFWSLATLISSSTSSTKTSWVERNHETYVDRRMTVPSTSVEQSNLFNGIYNQLCIK